MKNRKKNPTKKYIWSFVFIVIAALTVWAVTEQNNAFSFEKFLSMLSDASPKWLIADFASMACFILFEALALRTFCRSFGYKTKLGNGLIYSMSDIYFSAITPSATGGQPASAYFMNKDGMSVIFVTMALVINVLFYDISIILLGLIGMFPFSFVLGNFSTLSVILIFVGLVILLGLCGGLLLFIANEKLFVGICSFFINVLSKLRIIKNKQTMLSKLDAKADEYRNYSFYLKNKNRVLLRMFVFNLLQRISHSLVTVFSFLALGGKLKDVFIFWRVHVLAALGSTVIPVPGAMGIADYIMLDGFSSFVSEETAVNLELLSRSVSFYICVILCGLTVFIFSLLHSGKKDR